MAKLNFGQAFRNVAPLLANLAQQKRGEKRQAGLDEEAQITRALQNRFLELGISGREQEQALAAQPEPTFGERVSGGLSGLGVSDPFAAVSVLGAGGAFREALPPGSDISLDIPGGGSFNVSGRPLLEQLSGADRALINQRTAAAGLSKAKTQQIITGDTTPQITAQQRLLAQSESDVQFENALGNVFTFLQQLNPEGFFAAKEEREDIRKIDRPSIGELRTLSEDVRFTPKSALGFDFLAEDVIEPFSPDDSLKFEQLLNILDSLAQQSPSVRLGVGGR